MHYIHFQRSFVTRYTLHKIIHNFSNKVFIHVVVVGNLIYQLANGKSVWIYVFVFIVMGLSVIWVIYDLLRLAKAFANQPTIDTAMRQKKRFSCTIERSM